MNGAAAPLHGRLFLSAAIACACAFALIGCPADDASGNTDTDATTTSPTTGAGTNTATSTSTGDPTDDTDTGSSTTSPATTATNTTTTPTSDTRPTTDDSESSTGPGADSSGTNSGSSSGGSGARVTANFVRTTAPGAGNDGIGTLYAGMLAECTADAENVASVTIDNADFSGNGAIITGVYENVPDGTHFVVAFLDDNENADPNDPSPDLGDLAAAEGLGPLCVEVTVVSGANVVAPKALTLNFVLPF